MSISELFRYRNDTFQSDIFSSDIGITDVDVGCRISLILRSMSMPTNVGLDATREDCHRYPVFPLTGGGSRDQGERPALLLFSAP